MGLFGPKKIGYFMRKVGSSALSPLGSRPCSTLLDGQRNGRLSLWLTPASFLFILILNNNSMGVTNNERFVKTFSHRLAIGWVVFAALVIAAAAAWRRAWRTSNVRTIAVELPAACTACNWTGRMELGRRPARCPACRAEAVWPSLRCATCGAVQPMDLRRFDDEMRPPYCQRCRSTRWVTEEEQAYAPNSR